MASEPIINQLESLISDAREQLTYFHELGIENVERVPEFEGELKDFGRDTATDAPRFKRRPSPVTSTAHTTQRPAPAAVLSEVQTAPAMQPKTEVPLTTALFGDLTPAAAPLAASDGTFEEIWADIGNCTRCPLYQGRTTIVHTDGNQRARLMFVGEAPGADEDVQGRPFVGRAGQLLTKIIEAIGFKREEVLIGNVNRCRPPGNRPPTTEEAAMCKPFLLREIALARPEVIVVLGNTAMKNLLDTKIGITKLRGEFQEYQGAKVMPTFHPAYLLRDPSKKRETWADLQKVRDYLDATRKRSS